ncbi:MAG: prepilin-type N-terminal cleavage/methylation domain-containing protein [Syntrophobacteraceae bacterium]|jgi:prepilin-type N-terminal cleavage/methylation domain-containing protein
MKKQGGFTLVELMVVVSIAALLLSWGIPSFKTWNTKHGIENQMVQLYSDLQLGRMTGYGSKVVAGVYWAGGPSVTSYQIRSDANNNGKISDTGIDTQIGATVTPKYPIAVSVNQDSVSFDGRGFLNTSDPANPATQITFSTANTSGAAIDCVAVTSTRITIGKMNATATACNPK